MKRDITIYVGAAITYASDEYKADIQLFKDELKKIPGVTVLEFCPSIPGERQSPLSPKEVYQNDILDCVGVADLIIAEVSLPSLGLGFELGVAVREHHIRTLMFAKKGEEFYVSRLIEGIGSHNERVSFMRYENSLIDRIPGILNVIDLIKRTG